MSDLALVNLVNALILKEVHGEERCVFWDWNNLRFSLWFFWFVTRVWWALRSGVGVWNIGFGLLELCLWWRDEESWLEPGSFIQRLHLLSLSYLSLSHQLLLDLEKFEELVLVNHDHIILRQVLRNQIVFSWNLIWISVDWGWLLGVLLILVGRLAVALSHGGWGLGLDILVLVGEHFFGIRKLSRTWIIVWKLDKLFWSLIY